MNKDTITEGKLIYALVKHFFIIDKQWITYNISVYRDCIDFEGDDNFLLFKRTMKKAGYWKYLDFTIDDNNRFARNEQGRIYIIYLNKLGEKNKDNLITLLKLKGYIL